MRLKNRESKYEIGRIIAMLLIVAFHAARIGGGDVNYMYCSPISANTVLAIMLGGWGTVGNCLFVILSSWFLCDEVPISSKKVLMLAFQTWVYCLAFVLMFFVLPGQEMTLGILIRELTTPLNKQYWFITVYIVFYLMTPMLNVVRKNTDKEQLGKICMLLILVCPAYETFISGVGGSLLQFVCLFFLTSYIRYYGAKFLEKHSLILAVASYLAIVTLAVSFNTVGNMVGSASLVGKAVDVFDGFNVLTVLLSFSLFQLVRKINIQDSRVVNRIAKSTLGVYILHENIFMRGGWYRGQPLIALGEDIQTG